MLCDIILRNIVFIKIYHQYKEANYMENIILDDAQIEQLSRVLGAMNTGSEISSLLKRIQINDTNVGHTKWRRLYDIFIEIKKRDFSSNSMLRYIQEALSPVSFVNNKSKFDDYVPRINEILAFSGIEYTSEGNFIFVKRVSTIDEVKARKDSLIKKLNDRGVHDKVLFFCREELLQENYFHAIFEASKSLCQRVRDMTGLTDDGRTLYDVAFKIDSPYIIINNLKTISEKNVQNGLKDLLIGINEMVRNVTAHEPKVKWIVNEKDAIDILMMISFLHFELDACDVVKMNNQ
jgi:uncharacterized protein (TIGR02391 family)